MLEKGKTVVERAPSKNNHFMQLIDSEIAEVKSCKNLLIAPLRNADGELRGVLQACNKRGEITSHDIVSSRS